MLSDEQFLKILGEIGKVLLSKSQTPPMKAKKKEAVRDVIDSIEQLYEATLTASQVLKRLQNIKQRAKTKSDARKSGNEKIKLSAAETLMLDLLHQEDNPAISRIKSNFVENVFFYTITD